MCTIRLLYGIVDGGIPAYYNDIQILLEIQVQRQKENIKDKTDLQRSYYYDDR